MFFALLQAMFEHITSVMCYNWGQHNKRYVVFELWTVLASSLYGSIFYGLGVVFTTKTSKRL